MNQLSRTALTGAENYPNTSLAYSIVYWLLHASYVAKCASGPEAESLWSVAVNRFFQSSDAFQRWKELFPEWHDTGNTTPYEPCMCSSRDYILSVFPLTLAASYGFTHYFREATAGANYDVQDAKGRTPLSWACSEGNETAVRLLLARSDVDANPKDVWGRTPLFWACSRGHETAVRLLLARSDVDAGSKDAEGVDASEFCQ